jgi:outer membrane lipoprotein-sorting protein
MWPGKFGRTASRETAPDFYRARSIPEANSGDEHNTPNPHPKEIMLVTKMRNIALAASLLLAVSPARSLWAADDLQKVLAKLDASSKNFHSASADFEFDTITTEPIYEKDVQTGSVYYDRSTSNFQMAAHIRDENSKPVPKIVVYKGGKMQLYEKLTDHVTTLSKLSQYGDFFRLGFGASGQELAARWDITYMGDERIDGVNTAKLEMVPKDPTVKKNLPRVTLWMDTDRAVSLKQHFDQGQGQSRDSVYTNIKLNRKLPSDAFTFTTDKQTQFTNQ